MLAWLRNSNHTWSWLCFRCYSRTWRRIPFLCFLYLAFFCKLCYVKSLCQLWWCGIRNSDNNLCTLQFNSSCNILQKCTIVDLWVQSMEYELVWSSTWHWPWTHSLPVDAAKLHWIQRTTAKHASGTEATQFHGANRPVAGSYRWETFFLMLKDTN